MGYACLSWIYIFIALLHLVEGFPDRSTRGPLCYSCSHQRNQNGCSSLRICGRDENCHIRQTSDPVHGVMYTTGCVSKIQCKALSIFGKRGVSDERLNTKWIQRRTEQCLYCCDDDFCNINCTSAASRNPIASTNFISPTTSFHTKANTQCFDAISNCAAYGKEVCHLDPHGYPGWPERNCRKYCGFCGISSTAQRYNPNPATTVISPSTSSQCIDRIPNCAAYGKNVCHLDPHGYPGWPEHNCRKYCGLCGNSRRRESRTPTGETYKTGKNWTDGCYNCTCINGPIGFFWCDRICHPTQKGSPNYLFRLH